ncbi:MAG: RHS repeat-associated core domain-containing protein, partial [Kiritimatiellae bacterium]|nr:RHS repeat-associated core domain-containing protein [Kiritimatiellia bacterium]
DYSPFGELLISTAPHPSPFRFSTKHHDPETDTLYYGYRHYSPRLGRWLSRDPLGENGGLNLFVFLENSGGGSLDMLGLTKVSITSHVENHSDKNGREIPFASFDVEILEPPEEPCHLNFIALKNPEGEWSLDNGPDLDPYYLKVGQAKNFTKINEAGNPVLKFLDSPGGTGVDVDSWLHFYLFVVEVCPISCKQDTLWLKFYAEEDAKIIDYRKWSAKISGVSDKAFDFHEEQNGGVDFPEMTPPEIQNFFDQNLNQEKWKESGPLDVELRVNVHF